MKIYQKQRIQTTDKIICDLSCKHILSITVPANGFPTIVYMSNYRLELLQITALVQRRHRHILTTLHTVY